MPGGCAFSPDADRPARGNVGVLLAAARTRLDRYEELRRQFQDWRDVRIVLDRREGERRAPQAAFPGVNSQSDTSGTSGFSET